MGCGLWLWVVGLLGCSAISTRHILSNRKKTTHQKGYSICKLLKFVVHMIAILDKYKVLNNTVTVVTCKRSFSVSAYKNQFWGFVPVPSACCYSNIQCIHVS